MRVLTLMLLCLLLGGAFATFVHGEETPEPVASSTAITRAEAALGKKVAEQVEKEYKLLNDEQMLARLQRIAATIAPHTQRPDVEYTCKILDVNDINAMAIPGGILYFTHGLLKAVESDDELAGVVAHEIAHNSLYHIKRKAEREKGNTLAQLLAVLTMAYAIERSDVETEALGSIIVASELTKSAILNGYSKQLEDEADANAIDYLAKTGLYDPTGLYSVILGFRQMESGRVSRDFGYLETHPKPQTRLTQISRIMKRANLPINLWRVVEFRASVIPPEEGQTGYAVKLGSEIIFTFIAAAGGKDAATRADDAARAINARLMRADERLQRIDIDSFYDKTEGVVHIYFRETVVMRLLLVDLESSGFTNLDALGRMVKLSIQQAIAAETTKRKWFASD